jgi:hypothetical protein
VYTYRDRVPISYSKCVVSLRKDYAQEGILASIPFQHEKAILQVIQSATGKVLQNIDLAPGRNLEITLDVKKSPSGTYHYRLIVDGKPTKSKTLVVTH